MIRKELTIAAIGFNDYVGSINPALNYFKELLTLTGPGAAYENNYQGAHAAISILGVEDKCIKRLPTDDEFYEKIVIEEADN